MKDRMNENDRTPASLPARAEPGLDAEIARLAARSLSAEVASIQQIEPGLGSRRFFRVHLTGSTIVSVIARVQPQAAVGPPAYDIAPEPPLEPLRGFLAEHGLPVPRRYAGDEALGIELIEDLGDLSLEKAALERTASERLELYRAACKLPARLQRLTAGASRLPAFERRLDHALIETKASKFIDWTLPHTLSSPPSAAQRRVVLDAFRLIADECSAAPLRLAHRDFKAANLHLPTPETRPARIVMIDLQGAFLAPPEYDLMCLLRDSHVALPEAHVELLLAEARQGLPDTPAPEPFGRRFVLLTLCRVAKDISHYINAAEQHGNQSHLHLVPRGLYNLKRAAGKASGWYVQLSRLDELMSARGQPPLVGSLCSWYRAPLVYSQWSW